MKINVISQRRSVQISRKNELKKDVSLNIELDALFPKKLKFQDDFQSIAHLSLLGCAYVHESNYKSLEK